LETQEINIDEKQEEKCTVRFRRDINVVTDLNGDIVSSEEADWITIWTPGDPLNIIDTIANDLHKARFPKAWAEYQGMQGVGKNGTPIDEWDIHKNMIKVFKDLGYSTIEQVAGASEHSLSRIQGGWGWKTKAKNWLEAKKPRLDDEIAAMKAENAELRKMVEQLIQKKAS